MSGTQIILMSTAVGELVDWLQKQLDGGWVLTCRTKKMSTSVVLTHERYPSKEIVYDGPNFAAAIFRLFTNGDQALRMAETVEQPPVATTLDYELDGDLFFRLPTRTWNALKNINITTLRDLVCKRPNQLVRYKGIGKRGIEAIQENLAVLGLRFGYDATELKNLERHIDDFELSVRLSNVLHSLECTFVVDVLGLTEKQILTKGGRRSLKEVQAFLSELGFGLKEET